MPKNIDELMPNIRKKTKLKKLQSTLMLAFLALSLLPLTATSLFFLNAHKQDLLEQSHSYLISVRDNKQQQVTAYLEAKKSNVVGFVRSELAHASGGRFYGLVNAFQRLGPDIESARKNAQQRYVPGSGDQIKTSVVKESDDYVASERYRLLHKRYHWAFVERLKRSDTDDILLVDIHGNVTYSTQKLDNFATNLLTGKYSQSNLGSTFKSIRDKTDRLHKKDEHHTPVVMSDFAPYADGKLYAWIAAPIIQQGYLHSYAVFRLPSDAIRTIIETRDNPTSAKTLLVGSELSPRFEGLSARQITESEQVIQLAFSQQPNETTYTNANNDTIIAAYTRITSPSFTWALVAQIPEEVAYARIHQLEVVFVFSMLIATIVVFIASDYFSRSITDPLLNLAWAAEKVSAGDLSVSMVNTEREDEIGRLAVSFKRMQHSIRDKIHTIKFQNEELEKNLNLIQKQNQELQLADKLKDEFLATTSHELRTPLHGMIGIAETLISGANGPLPDNQKHQLHIIVNSGQRLANLVDDLLDYHKMVYGDMQINRAAINLYNATSQVLELSSHLLGNKAIRIINQVPLDIPPVSVDPQRVEQVLYNLIGNAIKYTDEGKIVISAAEVNDYLRIQIVDTGQGIPPEYLDQIFDPLVQAGSGAYKYRQGAGLGLSISNQLIGLMGGALYVSSQPSVGTTFSFTLPIASIEEIREAEQHTPRGHFQLPVSSKSIPLENSALPDNEDGALIIVVDDEPVNLQILDSFLRLEGYRVKTASNGADAISLIESGKPELLLLDVMMPGMSGYDICKHVREQYSHTQLPIIMLTALSQVEDRRRGFSAGANDYLTKPFNKQELAARIAAQLAVGRAERKREENALLQQELKRRELIEANLLQTQERLLEQLESAPEAIVCYRKDKRIRFVNETATRLFHRTPEQLRRSNINEIVPSMHLEPHNGHYCGDIEIYNNGKTDVVPADILALPEGSDMHYMLILNIREHNTPPRISQLETAIEALSSYAFEGDKTKLAQLKSLGGEFSGLADRAPSQDTEKQELIRHTLVEGMCASLAYWEHSSGSSKFEFAERSGLWRVYLDRSTLQTRTLDKYLHLETLPKTPRWRTVLNSMDYILDNCANEGSEREHIIQLRNQLRTLLLT